MRELQPLVLSLDSELSSLPFVAAPLFWPRFNWDLGFDTAGVDVTKPRVPVDELGPATAAKLSSI